jgi:hypothetical protein
MNAPPPQYQHVITNLPFYPLYNPAIHRPADQTLTSQSGSNASRGSMSAIAYGTNNPTDAAPSPFFPEGRCLPSSQAPQCAASSDHDQEEEGNNRGASIRRFSSAPASSTSAGATLPFTCEARSAVAPPAAPAAAQTVDLSSSPASITSPVSEAERRRWFAERVTEDPFSVPSSSSRAVPSAPPVLDAAALYRRVESLPVQAIKWHWEPDNGSSAWTPYDASLCETIERRFQLWILAVSTTCPICESRRRHLPFHVSSIESSFLHNVRPDLVWKFSFTEGRVGNAIYFQVWMRCFARFPRRHVSYHTLTLRKM